MGKAPQLATSHGLDKFWLCLSTDRRLLLHSTDRRTVSEPAVTPGITQKSVERVLQTGFRLPVPTKHPLGHITDGARLKVPLCTPGLLKEQSCHMLGHDTSTAKCPKAQQLLLAWPSAPVQSLTHPPSLTKERLNGKHPETLLEDRRIAFRRMPMHVCVCLGGRQARASPRLRC